MSAEAETRSAYRRQKKLAKQRKERLDNAVRAMLSHPDTRDYLWWLLEIGKVGMQPFTGNDASTNFQCGELNVGQQILAHILDVDPDGYVTMVKEQQHGRDTDPLTGPDTTAGADDGTAEDD